MITMTGAINPNMGDGSMSGQPQRPERFDSGVATGETKPCPYCGEQTLAVAVKCKHCGSAIGSASNAVKSQFKMRPMFSILALIVVSITGAVFAYNWRQTGTVSGQGFTDADISNIELSISAQFAKPDRVTVENVKMIRESPNRLTGFVKLRMPLLGSIQKTCTATYGDRGTSIWQCK